MKLGAHLSKAGSLDNVIREAELLKCETFQFFSDSPRARQIKEWSQEETRRFLKGVKKLKITDYFVHSSYLLNLFSPNRFVFDTSREMLRRYLRKAGQIKARGVVFHLGSLRGQNFRQGAQRVKPALEELAAESKVFLIFENSAGAGNLVGDRLEELYRVAKLLSPSAQAKVRFCIDTAHAFEAGYDLRRKQNIDRFLLKVDKILGLEKVVVWHLNDSATPLGSNRDRHAHIGKGHLGVEIFRVLVNHPAFKDIPGIIEVPQGQNRLLSDRENLQILRALRMEKS